MGHLTPGRGHATFSLDPVFMPLNGRVGEAEPTILYSGFTPRMNDIEGLLWHGAGDSTIKQPDVATSSHWPKQEVGTEHISSWVTGKW